MRADAETNWNSRAPANGWAAYGTGIDAQAHEDANIALAKDAGIDSFTYLSVYPSEVYGAGPDSLDYLRAINTPYNKYMSSSHHGDMKFMLLLQANSLRAPYSFAGCGGTCTFPTANPPAPPDTSGGSQLAAWGSYVATAMSDPQYLTINGKKILGLFLSSLMPASQWSTFMTALGRSDVQVFAWDRGTVAGATLSLNGMTEYPPNPGIGGAGQHSYSAWTATEAGWSTPVGFLTTALIAANQDGRALTTTTTDAAVGWVDQPTMPQLMAEIVSQVNLAPSGVHETFIDLHSWDEHFEDGWVYEPTVQGSMPLDAFKYRKYPNRRPSTYTYGLSPESLAFTRGGSGWTPTRMLASPCWSNLEMVDSTASDTISLQHQAQTGGAIFGSKCSGCGSFTVQVDASTVATVTTSNATTLQHQLLWSTTGLTQGTHTVQATIVGDGPVRLDKFEVTFNPRAIP